MSAIDFLNNLLSSKVSADNTKITPAPVLPGTPAYAKTTPVATAVPGLTPRVVPPTLKQAYAQAYKIAPTLPKGILEATTMQESSLGTNPGGYNPKIGESAWLVGMTNDAKKYLQSKGVPVDLNSQAGAISAMAQYLAARQSGVDDKGKPFSYGSNPAKFYVDRYKTRSKSALPLDENGQKNFNDLVQYYATAE